MKKIDFVKIFSLFLVLACTCVFFSCHDDEDDEDEPVVEDPVDENGVKIPTGGELADSYFWGTWIRMDNGNEYIFKERYVKFDSKYYVNTESSDSTLKVETLGTFEKQSEAVMLLDSIPLFRKGGANLEYSLKVVGFADSAASSNLSSRAAISSGRGGVNVKGKSENYPSHTDEATTDEEGNVKLKAPVAGDSETIVITTGDTTCTATGLQVNTNGANMGTIPIVNKNDCGLKITGKIPADKMQGGYLYANKTYSGMKLTIENIGGARCEAAEVKITPNDSFLTASKDSFILSTLLPGTKKEEEINITFGTFSEPYVDTGLKIEITLSGGDGRVWEDFIPLRVFRGQMPITIVAGSTENNAEAMLNGFIIYPDGNNKFFSVAHDSHASLYVPTFKSDENLMLVFSGATTSKTLSQSTEMSYTVNVDSTEERAVAKDNSQITTEGETLLGYLDYGEKENGASDNGNDTENTAFEITGSNPSFQAYLKSGDRDFYKISVASTSTEYYGAESFYSLITEDVKFNSVTLSWSLVSGVQDNNIQLYKSDENGEVLVASGVKSPYTVKSLSGSTDYTFCLKSSANDEISPCVQVRTPVTPSFELTKISETDNSVIFELENLSNVTTTAYIFNNGKYTGVSQAVVSGTSTYTILVDGLTKNTNYSFTVCDSSASDATVISNEPLTGKTLSAKPVIGKPRITNVEGTVSGSKWNTLSFTWSKCSGAAKYNIYEGSSSSITTNDELLDGTVKQSSSSLSYSAKNLDLPWSTAKKFAIVPVDEGGTEQRDHVTYLTVSYNGGVDHTID